MLSQNIAAPADNAQEILTARPEELTLMLYSGAVGFVEKSISAIEAQDMAQSSAFNDRAQSIIRELTATLDMQYEMSKNLKSLYEYMEYRLQTANAQSDPAMLAEVKELLTEIRDAWAAATKK